MAPLTRCRTSRVAKLSAYRQESLLTVETPLMMPAGRRAGINGARGEYFGINKNRGSARRYMNMMPALSCPLMTAGA